MPTKLGKGGHGHENYDKSTGKYVEGGGGSKDAAKAKGAFLKAETFKQAFGLKSGANLQDLLKKIEDKKNSLLPMPASIAEAIEQGNSILGRDAVIYSPETHVEAAHAANIALKDVKKDFPHVLKFLLKYGTGSFSTKLAQEKYSAIREDLKSEVLARLKMFDQKYGAPSIFAWHGLSSDVHERTEQFLERFIKAAPYALHDTVESSAEPEEYENTMGQCGVYSFNGKKSIEKTEIPLIGISFNREWLKKDVAGGDAQVQPGVESKHHFETLDGKSAFYSTATHELGHAVDGFLRDFGESPEIKKLYRQRFELASKGEISGYAVGDAKTGDREMIAEAFSDWYCRGEKATETNKKIFKIFKQAYDEHYGAQK